VYKDFDSIFYKIVVKLTNWELLDDEELQLAGSALKVIAISKQIEELVQEKNINKLFKLFCNAEMYMKTRVAILETFMIISKHISLRPVFLRENVLH
jgi:hypothetical protein